MFQTGQHAASYLYPSDFGAYRVDSADMHLNTASSWDVYSSPEEGGLSATTLVSKGGLGDRGSPLGHLQGFDRMHSAPVHSGLASMGSLTLGDTQPFVQAALERQQSLGWGGRPLQTPSPFKNGPQQAQRGRGRGGEDFNAGAAPPPNAGYPHHQRGPRQNGRNRNGNGNGSGNGNNGGARGGQHRGGSGGTPNGKANGGSGNQGYRRLWQQVTSINRGGRLGEAPDGSFTEATVEDLLEVVRRLPADASAVQAVAQGLYSLDSGALAALLKELNKAGHARRAQEIFDWLRGLDPAHDLAALCTTMTYTTMISQCGTQQALRRALELMAEMRGRGVQANVHTYSALMNVCIKANELDLALDVYRQMMSEGCTPNLVTYNTLIDVYGKTGAWEEAVAVLDLLETQGIEPEVRTYNTVIIACNQSCRAAEALAVYERMLSAGAVPTATTYTALISAYGKAGQLDAALQIFQDMLRRGCERNVITYSSLISACEKAGRWELALQLFQEMHAEGCRPNVVTYNSLIAACAQGAQWKKAQELFDQMQGKGCRPDAVTFGGLIAAYDRAGLWRRALAAFEQMRGMNCRPDTVVYNTIVGALWRTGLLWAQARAVAIFHAACRQGHFRLTVHTVNPAAASAAAGVTPSHVLAGSGGSGPLPGLPSSPSLSTGSPSSAFNGRAGSLFSSSCDLETSLASLSVASVADGSSAGGSGASPEDLAAMAAACRSPSPGGTLASASSSPVSPPLSPAPSLGLTAAGAGVTVEFGMHAFTVGSAVLSLLRWITELKDRLPADPSRISSGQSVALVLNKGKPSREHTYPAIKAALTAALAAWGSPFTLCDVPQGCRIEASAADAAEWLGTPAAEAALAAFGTRLESPAAAARDAFFQEDSLVEARCAEAFSAVGRFEAAYAAAMAAAAAAEGAFEGTPADDAAAQDGEDAADAALALTKQRHRWFNATADLAGVLGYSDEVVHDATLLLDRAVAAGGNRPLGVSPAAAVVAALFISARQAGEQPAGAAVPEDIAAAAGLGPGDHEAAAGVLRTLLRGDTSSISALRVLKLFLERLGADFSGAAGEGLRPAAGVALDLLPRVVCDAELRLLPPSTVAAATLFAGRRLAGKSPFWPSALAALTGLDDAEGGPLAVAAERAYALGA